MDKQCVHHPTGPTPGAESRREHLGVVEHQQIARAEHGGEFRDRGVAEGPAAARRPPLGTRSKRVDEPHFDGKLGRCRSGGKQFVQIFTEFVDWADGDDPQYWDLLPLTDQEADALAAQGAGVDLKGIEELGRDRRRLELSNRDPFRSRPRR